MNLVVKTISNLDTLPNFEPVNIFQTTNWMSLFNSDSDGCAVLVAVFCDDEVVVLQSLLTQYFIKWLPSRYGKYSIVWGEPYINRYFSSNIILNAFNLLLKSIEELVHNNSLFIQYRHYSNTNIFNQLFIENNYKVYDWYNVKQHIEDGENIDALLSKSKLRQVKKTLRKGAKLIENPSKLEWVNFYNILVQLYKKIHRPLPPYSVFERLRNSSIGYCTVVVYDGVVIGGCATLYSKILGGYMWYIAHNTNIPKGLYPSVLSTYNALLFCSRNGGGNFNFLGAGNANKKYGVRDFKLRFGGNLVGEKRYTKLLIFRRSIYKTNK